MFVYIYQSEHNNANHATLSATKDYMICAEVNGAIFLPKWAGLAGAVSLSHGQEIPLRFHGIYFWNLDIQCITCSCLFSFNFFVSIIWGDTTFRLCIDIHDSIRIWVFNFNPLGIEVQCLGTNPISKCTFFICTFFIYKFFIIQWNAVLP